VGGKEKTQQRKKEQQRSSEREKKRKEKEPRSTISCAHLPRAWNMTCPKQG
jgi:hypothetical protein